MTDRNSQTILDWIERMTKKTGSGTVYDKYGPPLDWGQALARECYGLDWNRTVPESPTDNDVFRASEWEKGNVPDWVIVVHAENAKDTPP
jgi:hypothetical protein